MAGTPLTDSIEALTTYANQKTGASDTNLSDAVYRLVQGYGSGGDSAFEIEEVVVGENSVTNMVDAYSYFYDSWGFGKFLLLKETPNESNQVVCMMIFSTSRGAAGRYKGDVVSSVPIGRQYDATLVSGTTYYKIYLK